MGKKQSNDKKRPSTGIAEEDLDTYKIYRIGGICVGILLITTGIGLTLFGGIPGSADTSPENPLTIYQKFCTYSPFVGVGIVFILRSFFHPIDMLVVLLALLGGFSLGIATCDVLALIRDEPGNVLNRFFVDGGVSGLALFFAFKDAKLGGKPLDHQ